MALDLDAIRARAEAAGQAAASGTTGTPPNVDGLSIHDAPDIIAESAEDVPALLDEVERLRRGRDIWRAERDRLAATIARVRVVRNIWRKRANRAEAALARVRALVADTGNTSTGPTYALCADVLAAIERADS